MAFWATMVMLALLAGCGAPYVQIQRAEFAVMYADNKALISVWMYRVKAGCEAKKLSADVCKDLTRVEDGLALLDAQAKAVIRQADKEPDWATIGKYVELAISLASKAAL